MLPGPPRGPDGFPAVGATWPGHGAGLGAARWHEGGLLPAGDPAALAAALGTHPGTPWTAAPSPLTGVAAGWLGAGVPPPRGLRERPRGVMAADDTTRTRRGRPLAASAPRGQVLDITPFTKAGKSYKRSPPGTNLTGRPPPGASLTT